MEALSQLTAIVAPVFLCIAIGIGWARFGPTFDGDLITSLVYNIGVPCLIVAVFHKVELSPDALGEIALATIVCYAGFFFFAFSAVRLARLDIPSYLPSLVFPLTGSMGMPVCYFAYGDVGLALAIVFFTFGAIGTFTIGAAIAEGTWSVKKLMRTPVIYAVALAVGLQLAELRVPDWIFNTTNLLGAMVIPAQLVALGVSLLQLRVGGAARSAVLALFRLGMGAGVGFGVAALFGLEGAARAVVVLQSAMPVAVSSYLFAQRYHRKPEEVAGMVVVSTAVSVVTLPLLLLALL